MHREREKIYIYGKHALMEALLNAPYAIKKVFLSAEAYSDKELLSLLHKNDIPATPLKAKEAGRMVGQDAAHQGVIAAADPTLLLRDFDEFLNKLQPSADTMLVLLDELTDPHNVGAIIRSAAAFGAAGVLLPSHNQAPITGAVVKASVGMVFRVPIISIGNVNYTIDRLKKEGFKVYALAAQGVKNVAAEKFDAPTLFIVGNEGRGIRQKTFERSDVVLRIPMHPRCESLNASVSAATVLYEWSKNHPAAMKPH
jgi:23S rRNA (guanosine2251-2'-O)-methyltransferase